MPLANLPAWTLAPDWKEGVLERLEWNTSVLASRSGAEQRISLRLSPRRTIESSYVLAGPERALFDLAVGRVGPGEWWLPLWWDAQRLSGALAAGATAIPAATLGRGFKAGGAAMLWRTAFEYELVEVAAVSASDITLAAGTAAAWPAGTKLLPARRARFTEQPKGRRKSDGVLTAQANFLQAEPEDVAAGAWGVTYGGYPVLAVPPNETGDLSAEFDRILAELDNQTGIPLVVDVAEQGATLQQHAWFAHGAAEHAALRAMLYALQGKLIPLWLPTFATDFEPAEAALAADTGLYVRECGFGRFGGPRTGREHVRIELRDGTAIHRRIVDTAPAAGGREWIALDAALGTGFAPADVRRISFMALSRLEQDSVEIHHETDVDGVSTVAAVFRSTPERRVAAVWEPPALRLAVQTSTPCGVAACELVPVGDRALTFATGGTFSRITPLDGLGGALVTFNDGASFERARIGVVMGGVNSIGAIATLDPPYVQYFGYFDPSTRRSWMPARPVRRSLGSWVVLTNTANSTQFWGMGAQLGASDITVSGSLITVGTETNLQTPTQGGPNSYLLQGAVADDADGFIVAAVMEGGQGIIYLLRYNGSHALTQTVTVVDPGSAPGGSLFSNGRAYDASMARAAGGNIVVVWSAVLDYFLPTRRQRVYARVYDSALNPLGAAFEISDAEPDRDTLLVQYQDAIRPTADGGFMVMYQSQWEDADFNDRGSLYVRKLNAAGAPAAASVKLYDIEPVEAGQSHYQLGWDVRGPGLSAGCADLVVFDISPYPDFDYDGHPMRAALFDSATGTLISETSLEPGNEFGNFRSADGAVAWLGNGSAGFAERLPLAGSLARSFYFRRAALTG